MAPPSQPDAATRARLKEIKLEDVDFEAVKSCEDKHVLKRYIQLIEDDGSYYLDLLKACRDKLLQVSPKEYYLLYPVTASEQEIDEATQDLLDWEVAVKETDKALLSAKKERIFDDVPKGAAPVRGQEPVVARANLQQQAPSRPTPKRKSDSYARDKTSMKDYYSAWDKVDVDAIEEEMEQEEKEQEESRLRHFEDLRNQQEDAQATSEIDSDVARQEVPQAHWRHMADSEKEKGNEAFYSKDFEEAEAYYSRSIQFVPDDPSTWANRALVRLKLDRPSAALEDCEHSLALNPRYMKALHRKGKALHELKRHEEAVRCFQFALAESPGNTQINGDLMVARRHLRTGPGEQAQVQASKPQRVDAEPSCRVEEITDEEPRASPPAGYTRVQIEEDDSDSDGDNGEEQGKVAPKPKAEPRATPGGFHKVTIQEVSDSESEPGSSSANAVAATLAASPSQVPPARPPNPTPATAATVAAAAPAAAAGFRKVAIEEVSDSEEEDPAGPTQPLTARAGPAAPAASGQVQSSAGENPLPRPPSSPVVNAATPPGNSAQQQTSQSERVWRRVQVSEASDSEEEPAQSSQPEAPQPTPTWRKLEIAEASSGEEEEEEEQNLGTSREPATRTAAPQPAGGDRGPVAPAAVAPRTANFAPPPRPLAQQAAPAQPAAPVICFDDMD